MDTKLAQVAQAMIDALQHGKEMDEFIDSTDSHPSLEPLSPTVCTFTMTKDINPGVSSRIPVGCIEYTVTVQAKYTSYDDE